MGKIRLAASAAAIAFASFGTAPASADVGPANVYRGATAKEIASLLGEEGVTGPIKRERDGRPIFLASEPGANGLKFFVRFHNCEGGGDPASMNCYRIQFRAVFKDETPPLPLMNAYHGNWVFGKVIAYDEERYFVEMPHNLSYGVTADNILHTYRLFRNVVDQFNRERNTYDLSQGARGEQANSLLTIRRDDAAQDASLSVAATALARDALGLPTEPLDTMSDLEHIDRFDHTNE
jgi:hypothetical protein